MSQLTCECVCLWLQVMEPGGADEAQGADALLSLAALAEQADSPDTQSADEGNIDPLCKDFLCLQNFSSHIEILLQ